MNKEQIVAEFNKTISQFKKPKSEPGLLGTKEQIAQRVDKAVRYLKNYRNEKPERVWARAKHF